jgi:hypothetical protein
VDTRYFASTVPLWALFTAMGAVWLARAVGPLPLAGPLRGKHVLIASLVVLLAMQAAVASATDAAGPPG